MHRFETPVFEQANFTDMSKVGEQVLVDKATLQLSNHVISLQQQVMANLIMK